LPVSVASGQWKKKGTLPAEIPVKSSSKISNQQIGPLTTGN
jgi:hypothetical protein